jgi:hypothetical protein
VRLSAQSRVTDQWFVKTCHRRLWKGSLEEEENEEDREGIDIKFIILPPPAYQYDYTISDF